MFNFRVICEFPNYVQYSGLIDGKIKINLDVIAEFNYLLLKIFQLSKINYNKIYLYVS